MHLIGIDLHKPTTPETFLGVGLFLLLAAAVVFGYLDPSMAGVVSGGVAAGVFGVSAFRSVPEFIAAGCCGILGALMCPALVAVIK